MPMCVSKNVNFVERVGNIISITISNRVKYKFITLLGQPRGLITHPIKKINLPSPSTGRIPALGLLYGRCWA